MNREFLMLAKNYDPAKHGIGGWFVSEKLDGMRAYWDGGISRGTLCNNVPYANTAKDHRLLQQPVATGLWSRYAKPIHAPNWFLDQLPDIPLDGELYLGPGKFQELMSIVKQHTPDDRWAQVRYMIFDSPGDELMFMFGKINNPNCKLILPEFINLGREIQAPALPFYKQIRRVHEIIDQTDHLRVLEQKRLPASTPLAQGIIDEELDRVTDAGGEGLILRKPESVWLPKRTNTLLKIKKLYDSEATVIGYTWGKGKLEGLMGAMIVKWGEKTFELSGFTDAERDLRYHVRGEPGTICNDGAINLQFPIGSTVTFRYTEVSNDGIPLKARYYRKTVS